LLKKNTFIYYSYSMQIACKLKVMAGIEREYETKGR